MRNAQGTDWPNILCLITDDTGAIARGEGLLNEDWEVGGRDPGVGCYRSRGNRGSHAQIGSRERVSRICSPAFGNSGRSQ